MAEPSFPAKQFTFVPFAVTVRATAPQLTTAVAVCLQLFASVMVNVYVPVASPVMDEVVFPLFHS